MEILVAILSGSALSALISGIFTLVAAREKKDDGVEAGLRILLHMHLKEHGKKFIEQQKISSEDLEDFLKMHTVYHSTWSGDDFLDSLVAKIKKLPIVD